MKYIIFLFAITITSCNWTKQKAKETANKTGEVVATTGSEFVNGVSKGVEKTFKNEVKFSESLQKNGLKSGKILVNSSDSTTDNILTAYLIFDENINQKITVKVIDENQQEYGRVSQLVKATKGEAKYFDFFFDKRTKITGKGIIIFE